MTYIEFFEKNAIENICTGLSVFPERIVLVGDRLKLMQKHAERYTKVFEARGHHVEFVCITINKNNMQDIIKALSEIIETYENCVFDLTGGDDLFLVAIGIISERYKDKKIQMHHFNLRNNIILSCNQDGETTFESEAPALSVKENVRIYGGDIVYEEMKDDATYNWQWSDGFGKDIDTMWNLCKRNVRLWNIQIGVLSAAEQLREPETDPLSISVSVPRLTDYLKSIKAKYQTVKYILDGLRKAGLLVTCTYDDNRLSVSYKNAQVKRCLTKAGLALEMKIYSGAIKACDQNGLAVYNDVMNGVYIDWDGDIHGEEIGADTENEIDVIMMHGVVPVFVSCKNGYVDSEELYKLNTVANRFGGKYVKKILVATALGTGKSARAFRQRAADMRIRLVEGIPDMTEEELEQLIGSFWHGGMERHMPETDCRVSG